jgi:hypothetical protein
MIIKLSELFGEDKGEKMLRRIGIFFKNLGKKIWASIVIPETDGWFHILNALPIREGVYIVKNSTGKIGYATWDMEKFTNIHLISTHSEDTFVIKKYPNNDFQIAYWMEIDSFEEYKKKINPSENIDTQISKLEKDYSQLSKKPWINIFEIYPKIDKVVLMRVKIGSTDEIFTGFINTQRMLCSSVENMSIPYKREDVVEWMHLPNSPEKKNES